MLVRILRPLSGDPRVRVRCRPVYDYGRDHGSLVALVKPHRVHGLGTPLRLTTNIPLSYVEDERRLPARPRLPPRAHLRRAARGRPRGDGRALPRADGGALARLGEATRVPRDFQREVIRSALVLKLHQYEDTGALLVRHDDEPAGAPRLGPDVGLPLLLARDSYFTLNALERLGHAAEMERFLVFLRNLAEQRRRRTSARRTRSPAATKPKRSSSTTWPGIGARSPFASGTRHSIIEQNDVYVKMILAVSRLMLDARFTGSIATPHAVELVTELLAQIESRLDDADAGPWELRGARKLHGFTLLMHWAARVGPPRSARRLGEPELSASAAAVADGRAALLERALLGSPSSARSRRRPASRRSMRLCSSALHLGFFEPGDPRRESHVSATQAALRIDGRPTPSLHGLATTSGSRRPRSRSARSGSSRRS